MENSSGDQLVSFKMCAEADAGQMASDGPLPLALVAVRRQSEVLVVSDRWKQVWELPGGKVEDGESPRDAAIRELREETGLSAGDLAFVGVATYRLHRGTVEHGALFSCDITGDFTVTPNEEISDLRWWNPKDTLADLDQLDAYLAKQLGERSTDAE